MRLHFLLLLVFTTCIPVSSLAQGNEDRARELFTQGTEYFNSNDFEKSVAAFREAYQVQPSWKILYNIGHCEAALKRYGVALEAFEAYLLEGGDDVPTERAQALATEIDRLRGLSGNLEVTGPEGAAVQVDGKNRGVLPLLGPLRVAGGQHEITVVKDGAVLLTKPIKMPGRGELRLSVPTQGEAAAPTTAPVQTDPAVAETPEQDPGEPGLSDPADGAQGPASPSRLKNIGWVVAATGAAVAIAGAITGGMAVKKSNELESACADKTCGNSEDFDLKDSAQKLAVTTDILLATGGVLAVTGIVMIALGGKAGAEKKETAVRATPMISAGFQGLSIEGSF